MDYSFCLFFFLYFLVCSIAMLLNPRFFIEAVNDLVYSKGQMLIVGFIALIFGAFIIAFYGKYDMGWTLIITVIGWLSLIKGVLYLVFPDTIKSVAGIYQTETSLRIAGAITLVLAIYFGCCVFCQ